MTNRTYFRKGSQYVVATTPAERRRRRRDGFARVRVADLDATTWRLLKAVEPHGMLVRLGA